MKKKRNEEYVKEVSMINSNIDVMEDYINAKTNILHKCKICGYKWMAAPTNILKGKGCPNCYGNINKSQLKYCSEVAAINQNIIVLGKYKNNKTAILHKCVICGCEWMASPTNILRGKGCPQCAGRKRRNHEEYVKAVNIINPNIVVVGIYVNARTKIMHRCSICGTEWNTSPYVITSGHGCPVCNHSLGEKDTSRYLLNHGIRFISQYVFDDCKNIYPLPFDFYLPEYNACIEYDGIQHFQPIDYFGGDVAFAKQLKNDDIKNNYCVSHNIPLLRIRYDQNIVFELDNFFDSITTIKEAI